MSLVALAHLLQQRKLSAVEVATYFLERIESRGRGLEAWVTIDPDSVLLEARRLDRSAQSTARGTLHGVPVGIKDIFSTAGLRTAMGSPLFRHQVPTRDADIVSALRSAGAVILGKTVTTQFAATDPGPTRNPWNLAHTPGGSSSGSAAAVAARLCPAATATQTVGSLGRPAAYCGLVGIMPTSDRLSMNGVFPVSWTLDHAGPLARSVEDACVVLHSMSEGRIPRTDRAIRPHIGVVREFFREATDDTVWERHEQFIADLSRSGAPVIELKLPTAFRFVLPAIRTIMRAEVASVHEHLYRSGPEQYGPAIRSLIESGRLLHSIDYLRALRIRRAFQKEMTALFSSCDVIVSPGATSVAPPGLESTGDPSVQAPWTLADFPTLSLPLSLSNGLPVGIQLTAPPLMEDRLIGAGLWVEEFIGFQDLPGG